ncbi:TetR/AcrR family transcriptional regulator [Mycobacterium manitobense]|uniref:TetR/AcrR family transcriptional regulator n=1 Tax=[Mycobacterium] manitobense TaxID=190147 RepID=A0A9X2YRR9_9MYCO|nr:TetR/AcrR family transcriptional regulator [[Mycobacterium] manitobense]MCV7172196.1 TetR/AcrR family transcriptional regulator [[Mycobacterium] manitobense]
MNTRDKLLLSTIDLVRRHGVAGTGIAAILERSHVSRRSIYLIFPDGKAELVQEATRVAGSLIDHQIATALHQPTPQESLDTFIAGWKKVVAESDFAAGCPIAAAGLARSSEPDIADVAGEIFTRWREAISRSLRDHGIAEATAQALANTVLAAVEGAVMMAQAERSLTPLDDVHRQLDCLLRHHAEHAVK